MECMQIAMTDMFEIEAVLASLVDSVVASVEIDEETTRDVEVCLVGGYLWKFPSEGSNGTCDGSIEINCSVFPPPVPKIMEYPRKCERCRVCWVSDRDYELEHLRRCSAPVDTTMPEKLNAAKLGVARRIWCEVDSSFSRLQWQRDRELTSSSRIDPTMNYIAFADIVDVSMLNEPMEIFQIVTRDGRTVVFQYRADTNFDENERDDETVHTSRQLELDAHQWQEYLNEISKYARDLPVDNPYIRQAGVPKSSSPNWKKENTSVTTIFENITRLLFNLNNASDVHLAERLFESRLRSLLEKFGYETPFGSLCDDNGNSMLHMVLKLNVRAMTAPLVSSLLRMGVDCNLQNHEKESSLLLAAASGDHITMDVLLAAPLIQVDSPCALGVTAFHAAANAGDVKMMQLLCNAGAQPELEDENGWTALHYAAACSTGQEALHFLCELLPDGFIDTQCSEGNTALHVAAGCGCIDNVRALLETAASPHLCNFSGEKPYNLALNNNHIQCAVSINDYQSFPEPSLVETPPSLSKDHEFSKATTVALNKYGFQSEKMSQCEHWLEGVTEEGYTYYYNTFTGESSWYMPAEDYQLNAGQSAEYQEQICEDYADKRIEDDNCQPQVFSDDTAISTVLHESGGHQLPLCLIPMVSPLTSLDNPTAAAKFEESRRKARAHRKRRQSKHRSHSNDFMEGTSPEPNNQS